MNHPYLVQRADFFNISQLWIDSGRKLVVLSAGSLWCTLLMTEADAQYLFTCNIDSCRE